MRSQGFRPVSVGLSLLTAVLLGMGCEKEPAAPTVPAKTDASQPAQAAPAQPTAPRRPKSRRRLPPP